MRAIIFVTSFFLMLSCETKNSTQMDSSTQQKVEGEIFNDFFTKFTTDSIFQRERVKFPFISKILDTDSDQLYFDTITYDNWKFTNFEYKEEYGQRQFDAYTQEIKYYTDSIKIELRGVNNGIHIDFEFYKENGKWFLVAEKDLSN